MDGKKSAYETWMEEQTDLAKSVRQYQWQTTGILAAAAAAVILLTAFFCWFAAHWIQSAWIALSVVACAMLTMLLAEIWTQKPGLTLESYRRRNRRALKAMTAEEREEFAQDQLEALQDPARCLEADPDLLFFREEAPFRFTLGRRYACMTGGRGYGPRVVELSQVLLARPLRRRSAWPLADKALDLVFPKDEGAQQFGICFERRGRTPKPRQTTMVFETEGSQKEALAMLRFHFSGEIWWKSDSPGPSLRIVK